MKKKKRQIFEKYNINIKYLIINKNRKKLQ